MSSLDFAGWKAFFTLEPWGTQVEDLRAALIAYQAGRATGWPKEAHIETETFLATPLLHLVEQAEAERFGGPGRRRRGRKTKQEVAEMARVFFRLMAGVKKDR